MINYGYFRHRFDAHTNVKLNAFVDDVGLVGFAYYYLLLEIYGAYINNSEDKSSAKIHERVIANTWRKRVDSCNKVMTKLQLSDLLVYTKCNSTYSIAIPNYLKYYGSYKKKKPEKALNKIKENKIKENILKKGKDDALDSGSKELIELIPDMWNTMAKDVGFPCIKLPLSSDRIKKVKIALKEFPDKKDWLKIISQVPQSKYRLGENKDNWKANFDWLFYTTKFNYRKMWEEYENAQDSNSSNNRARATGNSFEQAEDINYIPT